MTIGNKIRLLRLPIIKLPEFPSIHRVYAMLWRVCRKLHKMIIHAVLPHIARPQSGNLRLERLGTDYGGWTVPINVLDGN